MRTVIFLINFVLLTSAYFQEDPCKRNGGQCLPTTVCPYGKVQKSGLCPRQSSNIKCCLVELPYQEGKCEARGGRCNFGQQTCNGYYSSGLCPTQPGYVKCCISKKPSGRCEDKYEHALKEIVRFEGGCQNSPNDGGNHLDGKVGYTCMGITPINGWGYRKYFPNCLKRYSGHSSGFVKYCYDKFNSEYKTGVEKIYISKYMIQFDNLDDPAFFVCVDIAVNSGPGRVKSFMQKLGKPGNDIKKYATDLNEMHREFYKYITKKNPKYQQFLKGWLKRADKRDEYINSYNC